MKVTHPFMCLAERDIAQRKWQAVDLDPGIQSSRCKDCLAILVAHVESAPGIKSSLPDAQVTKLKSCNAS